MISVLNFIEIVVCFVLIFTILIQNKNVSLNLASMSSGMWTITKRWPEKVIHNLTIILATIFIINSLILFILSN